VDVHTGAVSGTPTEAGKFDAVMLEAVAAPDMVIRQHFSLFVDHRYLILGADGAGRDVARRLVAAARYGVIPGLIAVLVGVVGGVVLGALAAFYGPPLERAARGVVFVLESLPGLLLVFLGAVLSGFNLYIVMAIAGLLVLPETTRVMMQRVTAFRDQDFVVAARELGMRDRSILWNEIVWHNTRGLIVSRAFQTLVFAILIEVTLGYMGLGPADSQSLGRALFDGRQALGTDVAWIAVAALGTILAFVAALGIAERSLTKLFERVR
jgi:peptide/nickel transport system permease protein